MINVSINGLVQLISQLTLYTYLGTNHNINPAEIDERISDEVEQSVSKWLDIASGLAKDFQGKISEHRIIEFHKELVKGITWRTLGFQSRALIEAFSDDLKEQLIYRYPNDKEKIFLNWKYDWGHVIKKFPSVIQDVLACIDCYALGYGTAAVFHAMRILEYGLAALAKDLGIEPGIDNWQVIINKIESEIESQCKKLPRGTQKTERLLFLSQAAKEFIYFKDGWRNHVSHNRATYYENQALLVIEHVHSFMKVISSHLSETSLPH